MVDEKDTLRRLATRCREIAESDENVERQKRWRNLNDLKHQGAPLLMVSPEGAWREVEKTWPVECESEWGRRWETQLRRRIFLHDVVRDDTAFDATIKVPYQFSESDYGIPFNRPASGQATGAFHDTPILENLEADIERLHFRRLEVDRAKSDREIDCAHDVFDDLLEVIPGGMYWWTCGLTKEAIRFVGMEGLMLAMYDDPDGLDRLLGLLRDDMLSFIRHFEAEGALACNANDSVVGSGNMGYVSELPSMKAPGTVTLKDTWGFAESQETVGVSPEMFSEFIFPYQVPLLEQFGLNYYGCCEPVDQRWDAIRSIPNLRAISVSPWSNQATCAELFGRDYVYCRKPNPSPVCMSFDEASIRAEFRETLDATKGLNAMMVLKDTHTIEHDIGRLARWVEIGREESERILR